MKPILGRVLMPALLVTALAGCSTSPPVHYYTLLTPEAGQRQEGAAALRDAKPPFLLDVLPVTVPPQADQPQIMMRESDGVVAAYYSDRWTAPLSDEVRSALSYNLVRQLGVPDVQSLNASAATPVWHVQVDIQRFDLTANKAAILDATWRVRPVNLAGQAVLCRSVSQVPLDGGTPAQAVAAQQQAIIALASTIASAIRSGGARVEPGSQMVQLNGCGPS
jgi:uncharacterized lipoprotein YmbA